jgi:hypothetical protein
VNLSAKAGEKTNDDENELNYDLHTPFHSQEQFGN